MPAEVRVDGIWRLRSGLKKVDLELAEELRGRFLGIAEQVAATIRGKMPVRSGMAVRSVRGGVSGNNAYVQGGKKSVPYFGWLDFGSRTPVSGRPMSVGPWKLSGHGPKRGRFIYPAIDQHREDIERQAVKAMNDVTDKVLPHD